MGRRACAAVETLVLFGLTPWGSAQSARGGCAADVFSMSALAPGRSFRFQGGLVPQAWPQRVADRCRPQTWNRDRLTEVTERIRGLLEDQVRMEASVLRLPEGPQWPSRSRPGDPGVEAPRSISLSHKC